ncbi:MAG: Txe/YoeB family addiction module toxin [Bacteroidales bacterium]|nr:Txe/YoeB family addiction module toxin [Bacteroidales bacterium]
MAYTIKYQKQAVLDAAKLQKDEPNAFKKLLKLEAELREHPRTGTGHPEQLKGNRSNQWSRRITEKHRLIYEIHDIEVVVLILTTYGHYEDR